MADQPEIRILDTPAELFQAAAEEFAEIATAAVQAQGRFTVALSGGSTPRGMFNLLAGEKFASLPWSKFYFFWGDERHVPPDNPDSNYRMAYEALLSKVPVPKENVLRVPTENKDADSAARVYEETLKNFFKLRPGEVLRFDLILLGMGPDGHTASLFPDSVALQEDERLVVANWVEKFKTFRITFTYPVINNAVCVMFLVSGEDKAPALHEVLENQESGLPAQRVRPSNGRLIWLVDRAAASQLSSLKRS
jgi:6-phosphogluconolactonase